MIIILLSSALYCMQQETSEFDCTVLHWRLQCDSAVTLNSNSSSTDEMEAGPWVELKGAKKLKITILQSSLYEPAWYGGDWFTGTLVNTEHVVSIHLKSHLTPVHCSEKKCLQNMRGHCTQNMCLVRVYNSLFMFNTRIYVDYSKSQYSQVNPVYTVRPSFICSA